MDILNRIVELLGNREQKELTDFLGLTKAAFSDWKSGKSNSYKKYLVEIAMFFDVSIDYLVYGKKQEISEDEMEIINCYRDLSDQGKEYIKQQIFMAKEVFKKQDIYSDEQVG